MENPGRNCTVCNAKGKRRPAKYVATAADGLQWYECEAHAPDDNLADSLRVRLEPIDDWFRAITERP